MIIHTGMRTDIQHFMQIGLQTEYGKDLFVCEIPIIRYR